MSEPIIYAGPMPEVALLPAPAGFSSKAAHLVCTTCGFSLVVDHLIVIEGLMKQIWQSRHSITRCLAGRFGR